MKTVPYAAIRVAGGILAALWCGYVFSREGSVPTVFLGFLTFTAGWFAAQRFGRPIGLSNRRPWLDTVLPIAIAAFAILPAALFPFLGTVSIAVSQLRAKGESAGRPGHRKGFDRRRAGTAGSRARTRPRGRAVDVGGEFETPRAGAHDSRSVATMTRKGSASMDSSVGVGMGPGRTRQGPSQIG